MTTAAERAEQILAAKEGERLAQAPRFHSPDEGRYRIEVPGVASLEVDLLRRDGHQLKGEVLARCQLPGARTFDGDVLDISDLNLSSPRARSGHANHLATASRVKEGFSWEGLVEEFAQRILSAERTGKPAVLLSSVPKPGADPVLDVLGMQFPARHPTILFGDGGTAKSYLALFLAGQLAQQGLKVGLFDWELTAEDHRERLELLFGLDMPPIQYARCTRPLVYESERLRRIVKVHELDFVVLDSISFACHGKPEDAEIAAAYFQTVRQFGTVGSLHVAHISKALEGAEQKPFGSIFWHNGARSTWNVKLAEAAPGDHDLAIALHNRKSNLHSRRPSTAFEFRFTPDRTFVRRIDPADNPDLAVGLSIRQRMATALRLGALPVDALASQLDADTETVRRTARRYKNAFQILDGGRVGLASRQQAPK